MVKKYGFDVDALSNEDICALMRALLDGNYRMSKLLVNNLGANPNRCFISDKIYFSILTHLIKSGQGDCIEFLLKELQANVDFKVYRDKNKSMAFTAIFSAIEADLQRYVNQIIFMKYNGNCKTKMVLTRKVFPIMKLYLMHTVDLFDFSRN